jgi:hypothetical protein
MTSFTGEPSPNNRVREAMPTSSLEAELLKEQARRRHGSASAASASSAAERSLRSGADGCRRALRARGAD